MAKIMLDIGAHVGETLRVAMQDRWGFDRIYSFEPAPQCWEALDEVADERVTIVPFGLWSSDDTLVLHDPGMIGASLIGDKGVTGTTVEVEVIDAAKWFADNLDASDEVVVKVNCEGAECDVLDHLLASGELSKVDEMLVHFDVRKIPSQAYREGQTRAGLDAAGVPYRPAEQLFFGPNVTKKTENWLLWYHADGLRKLRYSQLRRVEYGVRRRVWELRQR